MRFATLSLAIALIIGGGAFAHPPETHRLEATPSTVAYGYYWSDAAPALSVDSAIARR